MEFLKNNWAKLTFIALALVASVFSLIGMINGFALAGLNIDMEGANGYISSFSNGNGNGANVFDAITETSQGHLSAMIYLAIFIISLTLIAYLVMKMLGMDRRISSLVLIAGSILSTIMIIVGIILGMDYLNTLSEATANGRYAYNEAREAYNAATGAQKEMLAPMVEMVRQMYIMTRYLFMTSIAWITISLLTFGLFPLVVGLKKMCAAREEGRGEVKKVKVEIAE